MAEYQQIEYQIGKDGKITETVLGGSGTSCTTATETLEAALGNIEQRELLPQYYEEAEVVTSETLQTTQQS